MDRLFRFPGLPKAFKRAVDLEEDFEGQGVHAERVVAGKDQHKVFSAVVALNAAKSAAVDLGAYRAVALVMPAQLNGANISFEASVDGLTWCPVHYDGAVVSEAVAAGKWIVLDPASLYGIRRLKLVADANQLAERTILIIAEA